MYINFWGSVAAFAVRWRSTVDALCFPEGAKLPKSSQVAALVTNFVPFGRVH